MPFSFSNMAVYIRNVIEPLIKSERIMANRESQLALKTMKAELDKVNQAFDEYKKQVDAQVSAIQIDYQNKLDTALKSIVGIDVGWIGWWPFNAAPGDVSKWLYCDGSFYNTTTYADLYKLLGSNRLPDYRGYFLRGVGGNAGAINTHQGDAIRNITGEIGTTLSHGLSGYQPTGAFKIKGGALAGVATQGSNNNFKVEFNVSNVVDTANEVRPVNKAVKIYIRALR